MVQGWACTPAGHARHEFRSFRGGRGPGRNAAASHIPSFFTSTRIQVCGAGTVAQTQMSDIGVSDNKKTHTHCICGWVRHGHTDGRRQEVKEVGDITGV